MIQRTIKVPLTLRVEETVALEVATAVYYRCNPHHDRYIAETLEKAGITIAEMQRYFIQLSYITAEFWHNCDDMSIELTLKPHEIRNLYLPIMYAVVFASVGNTKIGNYEYVLRQVPGMDGTAAKIDRDWVIQFSSKLEELRHIVKGDIGQIGNRSAQAQNPVMMSIFTTLSEDKRAGFMSIRDGAQVDEALAGLAALLGLSLVENAMNILYTGVTEVNFRELMDTIVEKGSVKTKTTLFREVASTGGGSD